MARHTSRRGLLAGLAAAAVAGCLGGNAGDGATDSPGGRDTGTASATATPTREERVEQLPEPSPLAGSLTALVAARDRDAVAESYGLDYDAEASTVEAVVVLEPDGTFPDGYRVEVQSSYEGYVRVSVHVDDLVPLAMADDVRKVRPPAGTEPHGTESGGTEPHGTESGGTDPHGTDPDSVDASGAGSG